MIQPVSGLKPKLSGSPTPLVESVTGAAGRRGVPRKEEQHDKKRGLEQASHHWRWSLQGSTWSGQDGRIGREAGLEAGVARGCNLISASDGEPPSIGIRVKCLRWYLGRIILGEAGTAGMNGGSKRVLWDPGRTRRSELGWGLLRQGLRAELP